jgi:hypothetical protein
MHPLTEVALLMGYFKLHQGPSLLWSDHDTRPWGLDDRGEVFDSGASTVPERHAELQEGHALTGCGESPVLYQGTTLVVP